MNFFLFLVSISLSFVGSFLDIYTTRIAIKDGGIELEANKRVRNAISKGGYKTELLLEAFVIILLGVMDSLELFSSSFFAGLVFLIARGLAATGNLRIIVEYRAIGINTYKERRKLLRQALQNVPLMNRTGLILLNIVVAFICFIIYVALLTIDFPLVFLTRSLVFGLFAYFIAIGYHSFRSMK